MTTDSLPAKPVITAWNWKRLSAIALLVVLALWARFYLFFPISNLSPDAVDYVNIARNLAEGRGFIHSIKWHFFTDDPVIHSAAGERPPLYPVLVSVIWRLGGRIATIDAINVLLGVAAVVVLFLLYENVLGWIWPAFAAAALVALNRNVAKACVYPWSEPLFSLLHAGAFLLLFKALASRPAPESVASADSPPRGLRMQLNRSDVLALIAGVIAALTYLARPTGIVLSIAAVVVMIVVRRWRTLALFLLPNIAIIGVWLTIVWILKGDPFFSVQAHHFRVVNISEGMGIGWGARIQSSDEFYRTHPILPMVIMNAWEYTTEFLGRPFLGMPIQTWTGRKFPYLGVMFFFVAVGIVFLGRWTIHRLKSRGAMLGLAALGHFLLVSLVWATHEGDRFLQPVFVLFIPLWVGAVFDAARWVIRRMPKVLGSVVWALVGVAWLSVAWVYVHDLILTRIALSQTLPLPLASAAERERLNLLVPQGAVIATDDPFVSNWWLDRPSIWLPSRAGWPKAREFFNEYSVTFISVMNTEDSLFAGRLMSLTEHGLIRRLSDDFMPGEVWYMVVPQPESESGAKDSSSSPAGGSGERR